MGSTKVVCDFRHLEQMANGRIDCEAAMMNDERTCNRLVFDTTFERPVL